MFKHKNDPQTDSDQIDPQIIKLMGPPPGEANSSATQKIEVDENNSNGEQSSDEKTAESKVSETETIKTIEPDILPVIEKNIGLGNQKINELKTAAAVRDIEAHEDEVLTLPKEDIKLTTNKSKTKHTGFSKFFKKLF